MSQPVPNVSEADVQRIVRRDFPSSQQDQANRALGLIGEPGSARVRLAVLKIAQGELPRLEAAVQTARADFRDVLAAAEYQRYCDRDPDERTLTRPEAIMADWEDYQTWLNAKEPQNSRPPM